MAFWFNESHLGDLCFRLCLPAAVFDVHLKRNIIAICHVYGDRDPAKLPFQDEIDQMSESLTDVVLNFVSNLRARKNRFQYYLYEALDRYLTEELGSSVERKGDHHRKTYEDLIESDSFLLHFVKVFELNSFVESDPSVFDPLKMQALQHFALFLVDAISSGNEEYSIHWLTSVLRAFKIADPELRDPQQKQLQDKVAADREAEEIRQQRKVEKKYAAAFEIEILTLDLAKINEPRDLSPLHDHLPWWEFRTYFDQFLPYILEEARDDLAGQYNLVVKEKSTKVFDVTIVEVEECQFQKKLFQLVANTPKLPRLDHSFAQEAVLLTATIANKPVQLMGIASVTYQDSDSKSEKVNLRILVMGNAPLLTDAKNFKKQKWKAFWLAGLITYSRMYEACILRPTVEFLKTVVEAELPAWPSTTSYAMSRVFPLQSKLNLSQLNAVNKFCEATSGMYLLQGPPGTGKTTMLTHLMGVLVENPKRRIMVCAPSNKAVRLLAARCLKLLPSTQMALTGIADDIGEDLQAIYIQGQIEQRIRCLDESGEQLQDCFDQLKFRMNSGPRQSKENGNVHVQNFERLLAILLGQIQEVVDFCDSLCDESHFSKDLASMASVKKFSSETRQILRQAEAATAEYLQVVRYIDQILDSGEYQSAMWPSVELHSDLSSLIRNRVPNDLNATHLCLKEMRLNFAKRLKKEAAHIEVLLLQHAQIVFCTLVSSGRRWINKCIQKVDMLIIDEAGQAVEPMTLIPFKFRPTICLQVGDTKQLPATVKSKTAQRNRFDRSMMFRLMETRVNAHEMLSIQYRMHPDICHWPSERYYEGRLVTLPEVRDRQSPLIQAGVSVDSPYRFPCRFFHIDGNERRGQGASSSSSSNQDEVNAVMKTLSFLLTLVKPHQIGVITFYAAQVDLFRNALGASGVDSKLKDVQVSTVDGFQGEEKDIIIISTVRTCESVGFLNDQRRLTVALTRAKHHLFVFGNAHVLERSNSDFAHIIPHYQKNEWVVMNAFSS